MSGSFSASRNTSPVQLVTQPDASANNHDVSGTASPSKPEAITSAAFAQCKEILAARHELNDDFRKSKSSAIPSEGQAGSPDDVGSDPNTPRLLPTKNGSNDLGNIPQEAVASLNYVKSSIPDNSSPSSISSKDHSPLSQTPSDTFSSSVSEPGSRGARRLQEAAQQQGPGRGGKDRAYVKSWLQGSQHVDTFPLAKSTVGPGIPRLKFQQTPAPFRMADQRKQELGHPLAVADYSAREEAFSERNRSSSRGSQSRVEKRIEATLADAEPTLHARSRKSSHTLGLFKETTGPQSIRRGPERSRTSSDNAIDSFNIAGSAFDRDLRRHEWPDRLNPDETQTEGPAPEIHNTTSKEREDDAAKIKDGSQSLAEAARPVKDVKSSVKNVGQTRRTSDVSADDSNTKTSSQHLTGSDGSKYKVPPRLLEEIRNHHNLAAPFHDKFRSSHYKPASRKHDRGEPEDLSQPQDISETEPSESKDPTKAETDEDREEEDSEHISSILYNPHQAPSPDALEDVTIDDARKLKDALTDSGSRLPEPALSAADENEKRDVDISLQVHNKNRYFHGDLSKAQLSQIETERKQGARSGFSSASESEYESQDENKPPGSQEDSSLTDDGEMTPRASPNTRKSYLSSRLRKRHRAPAAPLGAVELKPFNHQVGGHTNLFRFSKRAICKQLSNRENEFYEVVERQHPELLKFLPKYELLVCIHLRARNFSLSYCFPTPARGISDYMY